MQKFSCNIELNAFNKFSLLGNTIDDAFITKETGL